MRKRYRKYVAPYLSWYQAILILLLLILLLHMFVGCSPSKTLCQMCGGDGQISISIPQEQQCEGGICNVTSSNLQKPLFTIQNQICPECNGSGYIE